MSLERYKAVPPGGEYPITSISTGPASTANTVKWGNDTLLTDERISREPKDGIQIDGGRD